jgi:hypothetical protein
MSTEPERNIENTLKSYAKKRKEAAGAPLEMHPATRRLLQSEVARTFSKEARRSGWLNIFSGFWPRFALGGAIFIVLGIGIWGLVSERPKQTVAGEFALNRERELRDKEKDKLAPSRKLQLGIPQKKEAVPGKEILPETPAPAAAPASPAGARYLAYDDTNASVTNSLVITTGVTMTQQLAKNLDTLGEGAYQRRDMNPSNQPYPAARRRNEVVLTTPEAAALPQEQKSDVYTLSARPPSAPQSVSPLREQDGRGFLSAPSVNEPASGLALGGALTLSSNFALRGPAQQNAVTAWSANGLSNAPSSLRADAYESSTQTFVRRAVADLDVAQDKVRTGQAALLNTFSFQLTGDQLRVVDGDGSVYYGYVEAEDLSKAISKDAESLMFKQKALSAAEAQNRGIGGSVDRSKVTPSTRQFFRVSGTNLTLNEPILFTGNVIFSTNTTTQTLNYVGRSALANSVGKPGAAGTNAQTGTNVQAAFPKLEGKVVIGGTNQIPIDAVPVTSGK